MIRYEQSRPLSGLVDQKLAGASRKIGRCKHIEETPLCSSGLARHRFACERLICCRCLSRVLTGSRTTNDEESCACQKDTKEEGIHADILRARVLASNKMRLSSSTESNWFSECLPMAGRQAPDTAPDSNHPERKL